mmetsp:Transcript_25367/g.39276  ORF Transcript_25367/g.39276 Transcript_25367/m.39276 type:complete len:461 (-) Transcript_25367:137-1519(-)
MPRRGNRRRKARTHVVEDEKTASALVSSEENKIPHSAVFKRGKVVPEVNELILDIRQIMRPYTALELKDATIRNKSATLATYSKHLAGPMGVTHLLAINQNKSRVNLRIARTPAGPTLLFNVQKFSLCRQIKAVQRRPFSSKAAMDHPPIVVTNNFGDKDIAPHVKLMRITFQKMFPAVNVATVRLSDVRRVVLFNLIQQPVTVHTHTSTDADAGTYDTGENNDKNNNEANITSNAMEDVVEVRHYAIKATPVGVDRKVRRVVRTKIPNLGKLNDIAEYIVGSGNGMSTAGDVSESEAEDETTHVVLSEKYTGRGNNKSQKSALKLVEIGPRLRMKLVKVERGLGGGDVMYHAFIKKTAAEVKAQKKKVEEAAALKKRRREEQESNVAAKLAAKEEKKVAKKARKEEREKEAMDALRKGGISAAQSDDAEEEEANDSGSTGSENSSDSGGGAEDVDDNWG